MFSTVKGFLRTQGKIIVNEDGKEILLRGMGAGSWLNPEGFMFGGAPFGGKFGGFSRAFSFDRGRTPENDD